MQLEAIQELIRILRKAILLLLKIPNSCDGVQHRDAKPEEIPKVPAAKLLNEYRCTTHPNGPAKLLLQQEAWQQGTQPVKQKLQVLHHVGDSPATSSLQAGYCYLVINECC